MRNAFNGVPGIRRGAAAVLLALLASVAVNAGAAVTEGRTNDGRRYLAGGIGTEEVDALRAQADAYSLQLVTAATSGAYLAGTQIRITGPGNAVILDAPIDAPWLLVDLPPGQYTVRATHAGQTREQRITLGANKPHRVVLHFDVPAENAGPGAVSGEPSRVAR